MRGVSVICPLLMSIDFYGNKPISQQTTYLIYAIAVCSNTYMLCRGYPKKMFKIAQMTLCSLKLYKMDKNNHKGQRWPPKRGDENYVINFLRTPSTQ